MPPQVVIIKKTKSAIPQVKWGSVANAVRKTLKRRALEPIQLVFVTSREIQRINKTYRGKDRPTNVLSFPETRDVLIAPAVVVKEEMVKLFIHAILHLEGYTHERDRDTKKMERLEEKILKTLNPKL